jgi:dipeptidyl aminopeptidase/acylaminoacyl peptidase
VITGIRCQQRRHRCRVVRWIGIIWILALVALPQHVSAQVPLQTETGDRYVLPPETVRDIFSRDKNYATLDQASPDASRFLIPRITELSTLDRMAVETYRLAMLEIRPQVDRLWHLDTFGIYGLQVYSLSDRAFRDISLPDGIFVSDMTWSPDGSQIAFLAHLPHGTEVWTADAATGRARRLSDARVMVTIATRSQAGGMITSRMVQWTPDGGVITLLVPADRGTEPQRDPVPSTPVIRRTREKPTPTRTLPFLLKDEHDKALFTYYTRSQIAELRPGRRPRLIGEPGIYESISLNPDGQYLMTEKIEEPFSFITSYQGFAGRTEVMDLAGNVLAVLDEQELREGARSPRDDNEDNEPRDWSWRPDGVGLSFLQREPGEGDALSSEEDDARGDRIMSLTPPFDMDRARVVARSDDPLSDVSYSADGGHAFATVSKDDEQAIAAFALNTGEPERHLIVDFYDPDDVTEHPGELMVKQIANGISYAVVSTDGRAVYLQGDGLKDDFKPQPFVDRIALTDGQATRIFEGSDESFDRPLVPLDDDFSRMIVSRESKTTFPDSYLWTGNGSMENLTRNANPFPEVAAAQRVDFEFVRRDGLKVRARISLPIDYQEGTRAPAIFWTYPREYDDAEEYQRAAIRSRNENAFTHMSWLRWSDIWLTQGYALVYPDIPIIGESYNDNYVAHLVDGMYGALRAVDRLGYVDVDRVGHGGHSYGAFATANILANAPFFKAGIAGDGAYNRSLTPMGFQSERRDIWEAPHIYFEMSPFFKADQINTPLLMYHGADDNNSGTYPIQSERLIQVLTGLGKTAVLYLYPFESHTPRAIENNLDMWARWLEWFDKYVKGGEAAEQVVSQSEGRRP